VRDNGADRLDLMTSTAAQQSRAESLAHLFGRQQRNGLFPGGQLVVSRRSEILVDTNVGIARGLRPEEGRAPEPVTPATRFQTMSVSKAVVAFAIAVLEDRGLVAVGAPVSRYWPEFAANGKEEITLLDVLTHRSGLLVESVVRNLDLWSDWDALTSSIAEAKPERPRGTLCYESHAFGWICAEVVRRVTARPLPDFLAEAFRDDLGPLEFETPSNAPPAARTYWLGNPKYLLGTIDVAKGFEHANNDVACRIALVPGAGMLTTARALAGFYELLLAGGITPSGRRILREETLRRYTTRRTSGFEPLTRSYVVLGQGFLLGWPFPHLYGWRGSSGCYGHAGGFSCLGFADPAAEVAVAILTNGNRSLLDMIRRFAPLAAHARRV
jgi:CubicO group peptidase (beta-lactamase class C family)